MNGNGRRIYRVSEITRLIKNTLEDAFGEVWIEGELSNVRRPSSGHCYFTIKDDTSQISAVMFRGNQQSLRFELKDGLLVRVFGQISVYERSGSYQIIVRGMEEAGKGSLQAAFEALKKKLLDEGLFDADRKKPLPLLPRHIGIVTSPTGAVIRDILKVAGRRFPNLHIVIAPVRVQGDGAAAEIADALALLNSMGGFDVLIVARGGGSLEDLWCFNEEIVARAVAASRIPVISAVGHETDFTICDFVADARAPTPSAAAEMVVNQKTVIEEGIADAGRRLARALRESVLEARNRLTSAGRNRVFAEPGHMVRQSRQQLSELRLRAEHSLGNRLRQSQQRLDDAALRASHGMERAATGRRQTIERLSAQMRALNPHAVLARGYSLTWDGSGRLLRDAKKLQAGQRVRTRLAAGEFESDVVGVEGQ